MLRNFTHEILKIELLNFYKFIKKFIVFLHIKDL